MTYEKLKERRVLMEDNKLIIYKNSEGDIIVDAIYKDETLWLSQKGMSKVFECSTDNISLHLKHIFEDNELDKKSVTEKCSLTADDGKKYNTTIYSLDAIIAVGYRINSKKATEFRIWATKILKEYMTKGFALNDERFINGNKYDTKYFNELLERREELFNENFKLAESREFKNDSANNSFTMSPSRWISITNAKGVVSKREKYDGGTFAHPDIALEFASWIDPAFKLYLIQEFERLKYNETYQKKQNGLLEEAYQKQIIEYILIVLKKIQFLL